MLYNIINRSTTSRILLPKLSLSQSLKLSSQRLHLQTPLYSDMNNLRQGHIANPKNLHPQDPFSQAAQSGFKAKEDQSNEGIDAAVDEASRAKDTKKPKDRGMGNPEGIGFVDQVGSSSATARKFEEDEGKN